MGALIIGLTKVSDITDPKTVLSVMPSGPATIRGAVATENSDGLINPRACQGHDTAKRQFRWSDSMFLSA